MKTHCWGKFWVILDTHYPIKTYTERCMGTYSCTHTNRNAYFNHLASVGTASLSTICSFVLSSIVTFPRECVCVVLRVWACVFLYFCDSVCVITGVHTCLYIQCVFWLPNVHLVGEHCQGEVEVNSTQLNHWTALSGALPRLAKHSTTQCHHLGRKNLHWRLCF